MKKIVQTIVLIWIMVHINVETRAQKSISQIYNVGQVLQVSNDFDVVIDSAWYIKSSDNGTAVLKVSISLINKTKEALYWKTTSPLGFKIESSEGLEYTKTANNFEYGGSAFSQMAHPGVQVQPMSKKSLTEVFEVPMLDYYILKIYQMRSTGGWNYNYSKLRWKVSLTLSRLN